MKEPNMTDLSQPGWGGLDLTRSAIEARSKEAARKRLDMAHLVDAVFSTQDGQIVLEHLLDLTVRKPMLPATVPAQQPVTSAETVPYVAFREGQNSVVAHISMLIEQARTNRHKEVV